MKQRLKIGAFFSRVGEAVNRALQKSPVGRLFLSYDACEGVLARRAERKKAVPAYTVPNYNARRAVATVMEKNLLTRALTSLIRGALSCGLRTFGLFFVVLGGLFTAFYFFSLDSLFGSVATWEYAVMAIVLGAVGVLLLFSDRSLGRALRESTLCSLLLFSLFGLSPELPASLPERGKHRYVLAVVLAVFTAALTLLVQPTVLLGVFFALLLVAMIAAVPEAGFVLTVMCLPFSTLLCGSQVLTYFFLIVSLVSYIGKLLRGNRAFRLAFQDVGALLLLPVFFLSGTVSGAATSWWTVGERLLAVLFYLFAVNVLSTPYWFRKCRAVFTATATVAAGLGLFRFLVALGQGEAGTPWVKFAPELRVGFADVHAAAYYFVIAFALTVPACFHGRRRTRFLSVLCALTLALAAVLTFVSVAWLSMLLIFVVFALLYDRRAHLTVALLGGAGTATYFLLPYRVQGVVDGVLFDLNSAAYRASRRGVSDFFSRLFGGGGGSVRHLFFGVGQGGVPTLYTQLVAGTEFAYTAFSFFEYQLAEGGVFAVAVPVFFFFCLLANAFTSLYRTRERDGRQFAESGVLLGVGVLFFSCFYCVWHDTAALLAFLAAAAVVCAALRHDLVQYGHVAEMSETGPDRAEYRYWRRRRKGKEGNRHGS